MVIAACRTGADVGQSRCRASPSARAQIVYHQEVPLIRLLTLAFLLFSAPLSAFAFHDVIISEYVEGSSNNKAIELFNTTTGDIDLNAGSYVLEIYFNGSVSAGTSIALTGTISGGSTYIVADDNASAGILAVADQTSPSPFFNGNDTVVLKKNGSVVDALGQIGFDPGSQWGSGNQSTQDNTLRRKVDVCEGDTDATDAFDPAVQWDGFAIDTIDKLGSHDNTCGPVPVEETTWGAVKKAYE